MDFLSVYPFIRTVWNWSRSIFGLNREHDIAIFKKIDSIANEQRIDDILNNRIYTNDYKMEYAHVLQDFIDALLRIENQYIATVINLRARELAFDMGELLAYVGQTFWPVSGGRLGFRPNQIDSDVVDAEWKELNRRLEKAWDAYKTYRLAINERLMV
jgi:hypothetical protein